MVITSSGKVFRIWAWIFFSVHLCVPCLETAGAGMDSSVPDSSVWGDAAAVVTGKRREAKQKNA